MDRIKTKQTGLFGVLSSLFIPHRSKNTEMLSLTARDPVVPQFFKEDTPSDLSIAWNDFSAQSRSLATTYSNNAWNAIDAYFYLTVYGTRVVDNDDHRFRFVYNECGGVFSTFPVVLERAYTVCAHADSKTHSKDDKLVQQFFYAVCTTLISVRDIMNTYILLLSPASFDLLCTLMFIVRFRMFNDNGEYPLTLSTLVFALKDYEFETYDDARIKEGMRTLGKVEVAFLHFIGAFKSENFVGCCSLPSSFLFLENNMNVTLYNVFKYDIESIAAYFGHATH